MWLVNVIKVCWAVVRCIGLLVSIVAALAFYEFLCLFDRRRGVTYVATKS